MPRDTEEALRRLEQALRQEEAQTLPPEEEDPLPPPDCPVYNADRTDVELEDFSEQVRREPPPRLTGLVLLALLLMGAILGILGWWLLRIRGVLPS